MSLRVVDRREPKARPWPHPAALEVPKLLLDCDLKRTRGGGPGGQHRNRVDTAVVLTHRPTGLVARGYESRSQEQNRRAAISRLRRKLAVEIRTPVDPDTAPSALWQSRVHGGKISLSAKHADFPSLLAEALDVLAAHAMDLGSTAERLGCSRSQLVKLIKDSPAAFEQLNRYRRENEQPPLR